MAVNNLSIFDFIVILGISQATFLTCLLIFSKHNKESSRLLAMVLFTFIILSFKILLHTLGLWKLATFRYFPLGIDLAIQPLIYLYVVSVTEPGYKFTRKHLIHLIPTAIFFVHSLIVYSCVQSVNSLSAKDDLAENLHYDAVKHLEDYLSVVSFWVYWLLARKSISNYKSWLNNNSGNMTLSNLSWISNFLKVIAIMLISLTVNIFLDDATDFGRSNFYHWQIFYLIIASTIYYMAIRGYQQRQETIPVLEKNQDTQVHYEVQDTDLAREAMLNLLRDEKIFKDPEISLMKFSKSLRLSPNLVSFTINNCLHSNFRNLINHYRIEEVKKILKNPRSRHLSFFGVALECGFNSEASFYRIFKKETGMSPKEFVQSDLS